MKLIKLKDLSKNLQELAISNGEVVAKLQHPISANLITKYRANSFNPDNPIDELENSNELLAFYSIFLFEDDARFILKYKQGYINKFRGHECSDDEFYAYKEKLATTEKLISVEQLYIDETALSIPYKKDGRSRRYENDPKIAQKAIKYIKDNYAKDNATKEEIILLIEEYWSEIYPLIKNLDTHDDYKYAFKEVSTLRRKLDKNLNWKLKT